MPYHVLLDKLEEQARGKVLGTTLRGIGPCTDKVQRSGIQVGDLLDPDYFRRVRRQVREKNILLQTFI